MTARHTTQTLTESKYDSPFPDSLPAGGSTTVSELRMLHSFRLQQQSKHVLDQHEVCALFRDRSGLPDGMPGSHN